MRIEVSSELRAEDVYFLQAMAQGIVNARKKYPGPNGRFVAFAAEFGEALHAVQKILTGRGTVKDLGLELCQAAGMAMRFAVEGDPLEFPPEVQQEFPCIVSPEDDGGIESRDDRQFVERLSDERDRYRSTLERISMMVCRCIDDGKPCMGCTKAGREAPVLAYKAIKSAAEGLPRV